MKSIGKVEGVSEDDVNSLEEAIDTLTSDFVRKVGELVKEKEADIFKV